MGLVAAHEFAQGLGVQPVALGVEELDLFKGAGHAGHAAAKAHVVAHDVAHGLLDFLVLDAFGRIHAHGSEDFFLHSGSEFLVDLAKARDALCAHACLTAGLVAAAHGAGAVEEDGSAEEVGNRGLELVVHGNGATEDKFADFHFQKLVLKVRACAFGPVVEGGLVAWHEHVLQLVDHVFVNMAHVHVEWRAGPLHLFLEGALDLVVAHAVFHHGVVFAHEALAKGIDFVGTRAVDTVHAGTAVALGQHGGALVGVKLCYGSACVVAEYQATGGVVGVLPHVEGIVGAVVRAAGGGTTLGRNNALCLDDDEFACAHVPAKGTTGLAVVHKDLDSHGVVKAFNAGSANISSTMFMNRDLVFCMV